MPPERFKSRRAFVAPPSATPPARQKKSRQCEAIPGAKPGPMPATIAPQLATLVKAPPAGRAWVQNVLSRAPGTLVYFVFDIVHVDGTDLRGATLLERKCMLQHLLAGASSIIRYSDHFDVPGATSSPAPASSGSRVS
jgi:hypothetical protein